MNNPKYVEVTFELEEINSKIKKINDLRNEMEMEIMSLASKFDAFIKIIIKK